jgi:hypothetical protein
LELTRHHGHLNIVRTAALQKGVLGAKGKTAISTSVHKAVVCLIRVDIS